MVQDARPQTSEVHGRLWGSRARDWADYMEATVLPVFQAVLERTRVGAGTRFLDVGCGSGMAAQMAAARGANVAGVDAAEAMLAIARSRSPDGDFRRADLESLPFDDASFDVVAGFNSFQYAGNPTTALRQAARVARRGGTIVIMTFGDPAGMGAAALVTALRPLLPAPAPDAPGPFALSDETALRGFATQAGLQPFELFDVDSPWCYASEATALRGLCSTGNSIRAIEQVGEEAVIKAYTRAIGPFRQPDGSVRASACFRCLLARP